MGNRNLALPSFSCLPADFSNSANTKVCSEGADVFVEVPVFSSLGVGQHKENEETELKKSEVITI